jgi:NlpC/P60 family putative phage cell wall peptidase
MNTVLPRAAIVAEARGWIGTRYRHQASVKGVGCDCLGLVRGVWRACIGEEPETPPPYAPDWAEATGEESLASAALRHLVPIACENFAAGDVLLFRWRDGFVAKHVAIAASSDRMIHAHDGASVCEVAIAPWWRRRLAYAFRFPGVES